MMNLQPGQGLTQEEFIKLSTKQRHAYTEELMGDRIMLTYNQALRECRNAIASDEKLTEAFQNFQDNKNREIQQIDPFSQQEILMGAYVDKFNEKIFLVTYEHLHRYYHYAFDVPSKELILYKSNEGRINNLPSDLSNMTVNYSANISKSFKEIWQNTPLIIHIPDVNRNNGNRFNIRVENQEYKNDNFYSWVNKKFNPLEKIEEINVCSPSGQINSYFNPAHATIDPADLINYEEFNFTKNAYSA